eukprot:g3746.t1
MSQSQYEKKRPKTVYFLAGQLSGMAGVIVGHPMDVVKTRVQTTSRTASRSSQTQFRLPKIRRPKKVGKIQYWVSRIYRKDGIGGFYRGLLMPLVCTGAAKSLAFGVYGNVRQLFQHGIGFQSTTPSTTVARTTAQSSSKGPTTTASYRPLEVAVGAICAGFASSFLIAPVDQVKVSMVMRKSGSKVNQQGQLLRNLEKLAHRHNGLFRGLYFTLYPCMIRECIGYLIYFSTYEFLVNSSHSPMSFYEKTAENSKKFLAGGLSGVTMWAVYFPVDTVKNRMQANASNFKGMYEVDTNPNNLGYHIHGNTQDHHHSPPKHHHTTKHQHQRRNKGHHHSSSRGGHSSKQDERAFYRKVTERAALHNLNHNSRGVGLQQIRNRRLNQREFSFHESRGDLEYNTKRKSYPRHQRSFVLRGMSNTKWSYPVHQRPIPLRGMSETVLRQYRKGNGIRGFYNGLNVALFRAFPAHATIFFTNGLLLSLYDDYVAPTLE